MFNGQKVCENNHSGSFRLDNLEDRRLLAAWGGHMDHIDLDAAVSRFPTIDGRGFTIANIDSGMSTKHSKLQGRQFVNRGEIAGNGQDDDGNGYRDDVNGWNYVHNNNNPADDQGHGTMTAGVMTAMRWTNTGNNRGYSGDGRDYQGVASGAKVLNLKVVTSGMSFSISNVEKALQYVIKNRSKFNIAAVNLSIDVGSGGYSVIKDELATLWNSGVWIASSSGNGYNTNGLLAWPGNGPYAAAIGAMNPDGTVAAVGSRGGTMDFVAPGDKVPFLDRGNSYWLGGKGTSYSAPFGTAAGVLIKQVNPRFSSDQIADILQDAASNAWDPVSRQNYRRLDLDSAIALAFSRSGQAVSSTPPTTSTPTPQPSAPSGRSAFNTIQAESFNSQKGVSRTSNGVTSLDQGDYIKYDDVNFGSGVTSVSMRVAVPRSVAGRTIELRLDSATGPVIGRIVTKATDGIGDYDAMGTSINKTTGTRDLYLTFSGSSIGAIDSFVFGGLSTSSGTSTSTSSGSTSGGRSAFSTIQIEGLTDEGGVTKISGGVTSVDPGDWIRFDDVNFGSGASSVSMRVAVPRSYAGRTIELRLDSRTGPVIGRITTRATDGLGDYDAMGTSITKTTGTRDLFLTFSGGGTIGNLDSMIFSSSGGLALSSVSSGSSSSGSTSGTRSAYNTIQAESLTSEQGATKISGGVGSVDSGDWIKYAGIDFGSTGATSFAIRVAVPGSLSGKKIQVRAGSPTGTVLGSITTRATDGYGDYDEMTTSIARTTGVKDIYLTFSGGGTIGNLDSFVFRR